MRVALIRRFYGTDGGAQRFVERMLAALAETNIKVTLICENAPPDFEGEVVIITTRGSRSNRLIEFNKQTQKILTDRKFDLVQSNEWIEGADLYRLGDGLHSVWLEHWERSQKTLLGRMRARLRRFDSFHKVMIQLEARCMASSNAHYICNSELVASSVREKYADVPDTSIHILRNIVPPVQFCSKPSRVIGFAGVGWERKGLATALQTLVRLPDCTLKVVGRDRHESYYEKLARKLRVSDRVEFLGTLEDMNSFYSSISVLIHPALYDPFPNVTLEALAYGHPVVVSPRTGTSDFSDQPFVFTGTTLDEYEDSLLQAINLPEELRQAASRFALQFDAEYFMGQMTDTLLKVKAQNL